MAATSTIEGVFCASRHKTWDSFTDQSGAAVNAGESLVLFVVSTHDGDMCEVKVPREKVSAFLPMVAGLQFGQPCRLGVAVTRYGYNLATFDVPQPAK